MAVQAHGRFKPLAHPIRHLNVIELSRDFRAVEFNHYISYEFSQSRYVGQRRPRLANEAGSTRPDSLSKPFCPIKGTINRRMGHGNLTSCSICWSVLCCPAMHSRLSSALSER